MADDLHSITYVGLSILFFDTSLPLSGGQKVLGVRMMNVWVPYLIPMVRLWGRFESGAKGRQSWLRIPCNVHVALTFEVGNGDARASSVSRGMTSILP
jgi:hypothetical protein